MKSPSPETWLIYTAKRHAPELYECVERLQRDYSTFGQPGICESNYPENNDLYTETNAAAAVRDTCVASVVIIHRRSSSHPPFSIPEVQYADEILYAISRM